MRQLPCGILLAAIGFLLVYVFAKNLAPEVVARFAFPFAAGLGVGAALVAIARSSALRDGREGKK